jgi:hypothetical protein
MTIHFWPDPPFPQRLTTDNFQRSLRDGRIWGRTDVGPGRGRRRTAAAVEPISGRIVLTDTQLAQFESFWYDVTVQGSEPFWLPDQIRDGTSLLTSDDEEVLTSDDDWIVVSAHWYCVFGRDPPTITPLTDTDYNVALTLNRLP